MRASSHRRVEDARARGFTLVELVVAMSVGAVVVAFMAVFIVAPVNAYRAQSRRAELVDAADAVLRLMTRDIHRALPNSIRVAGSGGVHALELLATVDAARYRDSDATLSPELELDFSAPDTAFATLGELEIPSDLGTHQYYLSIYNVGIPGANAYDLTSVITPAGTDIDITNPGSGESHITMSPAFRFAYGSPANRVYLVRGAVTYLCDTNARTITRYSDYDIAADQDDRLSDAALMDAGATRGVVARDVADCDFTYTPGTSARAALASLSVTIDRAVLGATTERAQLLHQVHVENVP